MVGLPARGKTHIARRVARYLRWKGIGTQLFNVGSYRRKHLGAQQPHSFFDPDNPEGRAARHQMAMAALDDVLVWFDQGGEVAIYDATNITRSRRCAVRDTLRAVGATVVFLESICTDPAIIESNIRQTKIRSPDYIGTDPDAAVADFRARIGHYERSYEPLDEDDPFIQLIDVGRRVVVNRIQGWLLGSVVSLLTCLHLTSRSIILTRHGQSRFNMVGRIGGDSPLSTAGEAFSVRLAAFLRPRLHTPRVWTSTLKRTRQTAATLPWSTSPVKVLDEIDAGDCDGMTYDEIRVQMPGEFEARQSYKLGYRYPRGESYLDVINRLDPVILEIERQRGPLVIIAHQAVLRVLYGYITEQPTDQIPKLEIPLHTVIELTPIAYGAIETRHDLTAPDTRSG